MSSNGSKCCSSVSWNIFLNFIAMEKCQKRLVIKANRFSNYQKLTDLSVYWKKYSLFSEIMPVVIPAIRDIYFSFFFHHRIIRCATCFRSLFSSTIHSGMFCLDTNCRHWNYLNSFFRFIYSFDIHPIVFIRSVWTLITI